MNRVTHFIGFCLLLFCTASGYSQTKIDWDRMDRDLDIMKGIITKLVGEGQQTWGPFDQGVRGVYLEGYGVLFYVPVSNFDGLAFKDFIQNRLGTSIELEARLEVLQSELDEITAGADSPEKPRLQEEIAQLKREKKVIDKEAKKPIDEARRIAEERDGKLIEFLKYYADAINQLNEQDRVSILVDQTSSAFGAKPRTTIGKPVSIGLREISVSKKDIVDFRRGKIAAGEFENLVAIRELVTDDKVLREVDVFAGIIGTALGRTKNSGFSAGSNIRGVHIGGLGAVFFMNAELRGFDIGAFGPKIAPSPPGIGDESKVAAPVKVIAPVPSFEEPERSDQTKKKIDDFKKELVSVLGDYGHTLRTLKDNESVVVSVDLSGIHLPFMGDRPGGFVVKVQKSILDQYDAKRINFDSFMSKVQFINL